MPKDMFTLRFTVPPKGVRLIQDKEAAKASDNNRTRRAGGGGERSSSRLRQKWFIDPESPVFVECQTKTTGNDECAAFVQASALQAGDVCQSIYSIPRMVNVPKPQLALLDASYYPLNVFVSRTPVLQDLTVSPKTKKRKRKKKENVEPPVVICLDDSDDEYEKKPAAVQDVMIIHGVDQDDSIARPRVAQRDPQAAFEEGEFVLTAMGPGRVFRTCIRRYAQGSTLWMPDVVYTVELEWGTIFTTSVESLQESDYGKEILITTPRIVQHDLWRLCPHVYLNSEIIAFYIDYLQQILPKDGVYIYSSFFYTKIAAGDPRISEQKLWQSLKRWTKRTNIWKQRLLLIPINDKLHWSLIAVVNPAGLIENYVDNPCFMLHLDSGKKFRLHVSNAIFRRVRKYLSGAREEQVNEESSYDDKTLPGYKPTVPQQDNETDCGLYMLEFLERLLRDDIVQDYDETNFTKDWFDAALIAHKRQEIRAAIHHRVANQ